MMKTTQEKVNNIIEELHRGKHIDNMTRKWLSQPPVHLEYPFFYTLTKIHKPKLVTRPITERISSLADTLLQPIPQKQQSYITMIYNFYRKTKIGKDAILVTMNVTSCYLPS